MNTEKQRLLDFLAFLKEANEQELIGCGDSDLEIVEMFQTGKPVKQLLEEQLS